MNERTCRTRTYLVLAVWAVFLAAGRSLIGAEPFGGPLVLEGASIHGDRVAFGCGGTLWLVSSQGGMAEPITASTAHDALPCFSPDGTRLAFLRRSERLSSRPGATPEEPPPTVAAYDVFVKSLDSGEEHRLTRHPARDFPVGWTHDSRQVLLSSAREGNDRLFTMSPADQLPTVLPLPGGYVGSFSPDGRRLAYLPRSLDYHFSEFPYYRGGKCAPLWIVELESGAVEKLTEPTSNVRDPMWVGERIYFLSDRDGQFDLHVCELPTKAIRKLSGLGEFRPRGAATDGRSIVLVGESGLQVFDLASEACRPLAVRVPRDDAALRPRVVNAIGQVQSFALDARGDQAVVCARGDVLLVDTASGKAANVTRSPGVAERDAKLSPDGQRLAYFSDASGEYALHVRPLDTAAETVLAIEPRPSYYRELTWSPDGKHIAFSDKRLAAWMADLAAGAVRQIDVSPSSAQGAFHFDWSPDGRYLAYAVHGDNRLPTVHVYDVRTVQSQAVTPEDCFATWPVFDRGGRYLYFLSSPNAAMADFAWGVMAGVLSQPLVVYQLNAIVLEEGGQAPVVGGASNVNVSWTGPAATSIDFAGITSRIVPLEVAPHSPVALAAGSPGILYLLVQQWPATPGSGQLPTQSLYTLDLRSPAEMNKVVPLVDSMAVSGDGRAIVCGGAGNWRMASFQGSKPSLRPLRLAALPVPVDPAREWRQIFHETWRLMRDFFYDPRHHGLDWDAVERQYSAFLPGIRSREELNVLLRRMLGRVSVSHLGVGGGDVAKDVDEPEPVGLLGADLEIADGRYRFKRVLRPGDALAQGASLRAPLAEVGAEVADGEYLLAIDDEPLDASQNIYDALRGKVSRPVRLLVGPTPDGAQARTVRVVPIADETRLRMADWAARNRKTVDELSQGKLGYFHVATYGGGDILAFLGGYLGNRGKPGLIIDQRHNGGGITPDAFIEIVARRPLYYYRFREGDDLAVPVNGRNGAATVLLVDDDNGSAAETFAFMFKLAKLGPLVGWRTFGAGIGPYGAGSTVPPLVDGGRLRIPSRGAYNPAGSWDIENEGVHPDVAVEIMPADWRAGKDPQLEKAVQAGMAELEARQPQPPRRPEFPVHP